MASPSLERAPHIEASSTRSNVHSHPCDGSQARCCLALNVVEGWVGEACGQRVRGVRNTEEEEAGAWWMVNGGQPGERNDEAKRPRGEDTS